jgi:hypothetical protein
MKKNPFFGTLLVPVLVMLLSASCTKEARNGTAEEDLLATSLNDPATIDAAAKKLKTDLLKSVRNATSRFHSTTQAIKAGHLPDNHCVSVPGLGGMGYHWVNPNLVDDVFDPLKPEAILYAPGPGGNLRLVGLEYIVIKAGQSWPAFGDQPFDDGGTPIEAPHWSLHVWLYEDNPSGLFKPFNPNVSCP